MESAVMKKRCGLFLVYFCENTGGRAVVLCAGFLYNDKLQN